jgi:hypothetical protein
MYRELEYDHDEGLRTAAFLVSSQPVALHPKIHSNGMR